MFFYYSTVNRGSPWLTVIFRKICTFVPRRRLILSNKRTVEAFYTLSWQFLEKLWKKFATKNHEVTMIWYVTRACHATTYCVTAWHKVFCTAEKQYSFDLSTIRKTVKCAFFISCIDSLEINLALHREIFFLWRVLSLIRVSLSWWRFLFSISVKCYIR